MSDAQHAGAGLDVVGIGSMVVDRLHRTPRLLGPDEKGMLEDLGAGPVQVMVGGVVLNHLGWAAALGLRTGIFGLGAEDANGRLLRGSMDRLGIRHAIDRSGSATSVCEIFIDAAGERTIYMAPSATSETTAEHVRRFADFIGEARFVSTEVSQLPLEAVAETLVQGKAAGATRVLDLDVPPSAAVASGLGSEEQLLALLGDAEILKPSKGACRELAEGTSDPLEMARALRARFGNAAVVVTDGAAGCAVAAEAFEGFVPGTPVKATDTTGAGDAFLGGLLVGLAHGLDWEETARLANAAGAACVEQLGAFPEDPAAAYTRVRELVPDLTAILGGPPGPGDDAATREAVASFGIAVDELTNLRARLDAGAFECALALLAQTREAGGRLHVTGVGKPEHLAHYAASLFASTGTPATFLHATEAVHGSAGQVVAGDVVIAISNSGTTDELLAAVAAVKALGARVIAVTGGLESPLAAASEVVLDAGVRQEGGPLGFAPRASVAAELLVLASLAAGAERAVGLSAAEYQARHPAGALGRRSGRE